MIDIKDIQTDCVQTRYIARTTCLKFEYFSPFPPYEEVYRWRVVIYRYVPRRTRWEIFKVYDYSVTEKTIRSDVATEIKNLDESEYEKSGIPEKSFDIFGAGVYVESDDGLDTTHV